MARLNVYVPDDLAEAARGAGINISSVTQEALRATLAAQSTDAWLAGLPHRPVRSIAHQRVLEALDAVREEPATRHG
jgi:post-segregation antitoxin (ccd killing protein)